MACAQAQSRTSLFHHSDPRNKRGDVKPSQRSTPWHTLDLKDELFFTQPGVLTPNRVKMLLW